MLYVIEDLIIDNIFKLSAQNNGLMATTLNCFDVRIASVTFEFCCFLSEIRMTGVIFIMQNWARKVGQKVHVHPSSIQYQNASPHNAVFATVSVEEVQGYPGKGQLWHGMTLADCVHNCICGQNQQIGCVQLSPLYIL